MKKLLLLSVAGLVAAGCSTTDYYQDDLAVAQRLDQDRRAQQVSEQRPQQVDLQQQPAMTREDFERQREVSEMQAKLEEIDERISDIETTMEDMPEAEREQTAREVSDLRERQQRAETMLNDTSDEPLEFSQARDSLRDAVNELEIGVYRLLVRDRAEPAPGEVLE